MDGTFEILFLETFNISLKLFMASVDSAMNRQFRIAFSFLREYALLSIKLATSTFKVSSANYAYPFSRLIMRINLE